MDDQPIDLNYYHRKEPSGTWVSFCRKCFGRVAKADEESKLRFGESQHFCTEGLTLEITKKS